MRPYPTLGTQSRDGEFVTICLSIQNFASFLFGGDCILVFFSEIFYISRLKAAGSWSLRGLPRYGTRHPRMQRWWRAHSGGSRPTPENRVQRSSGSRIMQVIDAMNEKGVSQRTLRERIVDGLREAIVKGELTPGTRLQEIEVAERYETSRTPVREAFRQLESEGFLQIKARRGAVVTPITSQDVKEFYELKEVLEGYAAKLASSYLTERDIDRMEQLNDKLLDCYRRGDVAGMIPVHNEFHEIFVQACGNEKLVSLLEGLVKQFQRCRIALSHTAAVEDSIALHQEIIRAFRDRDAERAAQLVAENSRQGSEALLSTLEAAEG